MNCKKYDNVCSESCSRTLRKKRERMEIMRMMYSSILGSYFRQAVLNFYLPSESNVNS